MLIDNIPAPFGNHNAGDLRFGNNNGYLYISVGDGGGTGGDLADEPNTLLGKILRVKKDGTAPSDNPFTSSGVPCKDTGQTGAGQQCQEIFATGLRNPFRFAFKPDTDEFFINDVGQNTWEEIDRGQAGADYGWNLREGPCATGSTTNCGEAPGKTNPIYAYPHSSGCRSSPAARSCLTASGLVTRAPTFSVTSSAARSSVFSPTASCANSRAGWEAAAPCT